MRTIMVIMHTTIHGYIVNNTNTTIYGYIVNNTNTTIYGYIVKPDIS